MSRSKQFIILMLGCLLAACKSPKTVFRSPGSIMNPAFLEEVAPAIRGAAGNAAPVFNIYDVFKLNFFQGYAEADNVLVYAMLHEHGRTKRLKYVEPLRGFSQDLYLLRLRSTLDGSSYFVYFSVWYDELRQPRQTGFGPAYWGKFEGSQNTIVFNHGLLMKDSDKGLYLKPLKKSRKFFFVLNGPQEQQISIQRIVLTENNKIGANKMIVLPIQNTKLDSLTFSRVARIQTL